MRALLPYRPVCAYFLFLLFNELPDFAGPARPGAHSTHTHTHAHTHTVLGGELGRERFKRDRGHCTMCYILDECVPQAQRAGLYSSSCRLVRTEQARKPNETGRMHG